MPVSLVTKLTHKKQDWNMMFTVYKRIKFFKAMPGIWGPKYPTKTVITRFHFSVPISRKRLYEFLTDHLSQWKSLICFLQNEENSGKGFRSNICRQPFTYFLVCFELTSEYHELVIVPIIRSYWIGASVGHMNVFFYVCVGLYGHTVRGHFSIGTIGPRESVLCSQLSSDVIRVQSL